MSMWSWLGRTGRNRSQGGDPAHVVMDPTLRALQTAASDAQRSRLPQMAAALSYRTLFGLLPIAVVGLIVVRTFTSRETQAEVIRGAIEKLGLSSISVPGTAGAGGITTEFVGPMPASLDASQSLSDWVTALIYRADANVNFQAIGIIGLVTLVYAAISMLVEIERAFNQIYRVPRGRSWVRRVANYWTLLTLGTGALVATFYVGAKFEHWAAQMVEQRGWIVGSGAITVSLIGYAVTVVISTGLLLLAYLSVPNTRVKGVSALCGALVAALLWEAGKWGFAQYLDYSTSYARLYGSIALVPLFMLWVYVTWFIVLFGLQLTYQLQHGIKNTRAQPISDAGPIVVDGAVTLRVMSSLVKSFAIGKQPTVPQVASDAGVSPSVAAMVLSAMCERGLVLRIERPDDPALEPTFTPTRPPALITAGEVLEVGFQLADPRERAQIDDQTQRLRQAQIAAAGSQTLAQLAGLESPGVGEGSKDHARPRQAAAAGAPLAPAAQGRASPAKT